MRKWQFGFNLGTVEVGGSLAVRSTMLTLYYFLGDMNMGVSILIPRFDLLVRERPGHSFLQNKPSLLSSCE